MASTERVHLRCETCGHWKVGDFTKEQTAAWFRAHPSATFGHSVEGRDRASICPNPCGGER